MCPSSGRNSPTSTSDEDRILVQTGDGHSIVSCGGASSWQDLALLLIARHGSTEEAIRISRLFLFQWHREGQLPYASMAANVDHGDGAILKCQAWLAENYARADIVAEAVRQSGLPKRTFDRRFKAATGYSPLAYIQALRVEEAKQMLETGTAPVEAIGREVGYEDAASFRRLFRRLAGMAPGDYRKKFRIPKEVAEVGRCRGLAVTGHEARGAELALAFRESQRRRVDIAVSDAGGQCRYFSGVGLALQRALSVQPLARRESCSRIQYLNPDDTLFVIIINIYARQTSSVVSTSPPTGFRQRPRCFGSRSCHFS